jgi:hypothetical protein
VPDEPEHLDTGTIAGLLKLDMIDRGITTLEEQRAYLASYIEDMDDDTIGMVARWAKRIGISTLDLIKSLTQTEFGVAALLFLGGFGAEIYTRGNPNLHCPAHTVRNLAFATMANKALPDSLLGDIASTGITVASVVESTLGCVSGASGVSNVADLFKDALRLMRLPNRTIAEDIIRQVVEPSTASANRKISAKAGLLNLIRLIDSEYKKRPIYGAG